MIHPEFYALITLQIVFLGRRLRELIAMAIMEAVVHDQHKDADQAIESINRK